MVMEANSKASKKWRSPNTKNNTLKAKIYDSRKPSNQVLLPPKNPNNMDFKAGHCH